MGKKKKKKPCWMVCVILQNQSRVERIVFKGQRVSLPVVGPRSLGGALASADLPSAGLAARSLLTLLWSFEGSATVLFFP